MSNSGSCRRKKDTSEDQEPIASEAEENKTVCFFVISHKQTLLCEDDQRCCLRAAPAHLSTFVTIKDNDESTQVNKSHA